MPLVTSLQIQRSQALFRFAEENVGKGNGDKNKEKIPYHQGNFGGVHKRRNTVILIVYEINGFNDLYDHACQEEQKRQNGIGGEERLTGREYGNIVAVPAQENIVQRQKQQDMKEYIESIVQKQVCGDNAECIFLQFNDSVQ